MSWLAPHADTECCYLTHHRSSQRQSARGRDLVRCRRRHAVPHQRQRSRRRLVSQRAGQPRGHGAHRRRDPGRRRLARSPMPPNGVSRRADGREVPVGRRPVHRAHLRGVVLRGAGARRRAGGRSRTRSSGSVASMVSAVSLSCGGCCSARAAAPTSRPSGTVGLTLPMPAAPDTLLPVPDDTQPPDITETLPPDALFGGDLCTALVDGDFARRQPGGGAAGGSPTRGARRPTRASTSSPPAARVRGHRAGRSRRATSSTRAPPTT